MVGYIKHHSVGTCSKALINEKIIVQGQWRSFRRTQVADIIFNVCMKFENYPMKIVLGDAFYSYYILYHYFKISKIRQKFKNSPIVKKSISQVADIIYNASMEFENYPIITVGEDAFFS